jgi:hypothetical protein
VKASNFCYKQQTALKCLAPAPHDMVYSSLQSFIAPAKVAQLVEHSTENAGVAGSIPALGT